MSVKENQELMSWMYEASNALKGNAAKAAPMVQKWMALDGVYHSTSGDLNYTQYTQYMASLAAAFPDANFTVEDMIAAVDKVVARYTVRGTHKGPFMGIAATDKKFQMRGVGIAKFAGGKAVEGWGLQDTLGLMQQLGVIPAKK